MTAWVPPAYSPLPPGALWSALKVMAGFGRDDAAEHVARLLAERFAARAFLLTSSGTSALAEALRAVRAKRPGQPVALPSYSCFDVATAAEAAEVSVALYDLDPTTLGPDWDSYAAALRVGAGAVVLVHLYGVPVDVGEARRLAQEHGALLIEDAAQGSGAQIEGVPVGGSGSLSILSFGRGKGITAGSGGALLACSELGGELFGRPGLYAVPSSLPFLHLGETRYKEPAPARAMSHAALGLLRRALDELEAEEQIRRRNAQRLLSSVSSARSFRPIVLPARGTAGYLRLPLLAAGSDAAAEIRSRGARHLGVMPGYPSHLAALARLQPQVVYAPQELRGSELLVDRLATLPTHSRLRERHLRRLESWIRTVDS
jgi:dTDP-4-amino-4,6-dideoxygalactose transaminase